MKVLKLMLCWVMYLLALPLIIAIDALQDVWEFLKYPVTVTKGKAE